MDNRNALKHGVDTAEAIARRRAISAFIRDCWRTIREIERGGSDVRRKERSLPKPEIAHPRRCKSDWHAVPPRRWGERFGEVSRTLSSLDRRRRKHGTSLSVDPHCGPSGGKEDAHSNPEREPHSDPDVLLIAGKPEEDSCSSDFKTRWPSSVAAAAASASPSLVSWHLRKSPLPPCLRVQKNLLRHGTTFKCDCPDGTKPGY